MSAWLEQSRVWFLAPGKHKALAWSGRLVYRGRKRAPRAVGVGDVTWASFFPLVLASRKQKTTSKLL